MNYQHKTLLCVMACLSGVIFLSQNAAFARCPDGEAPDSLQYSPLRMEEVLGEIEKNNPSLKAARDEMEAQRLQNKGEAILPNPEVEFNYLWGADGIGNRKDFRVAQSFDIPTLAGMKHSRTEGNNELASLQYKAERQDVLLAAKQDCIELVYYNALVKELSTHLEQSRILVAAFQKKLSAGDANVLDLNKAKMHMTAVQGKLSRAEIERNRLLSELAGMNGGTMIDFAETSYDLAENLHENFEDWFRESSERSPALQYVRKKVEVEKKQLSIDKASWLPELSVGYMSELLTEEKFRGVSFGIIIPLWSNANKVKQSKARMTAAKSQQNAAEQNFYYALLNKYNEASRLKASSEMMRAYLIDTDNRPYLLSAQTKGEISIIEYLVDTDLYYEALEETLSAERDYRLALAELNATDL